MVMRETRFNIIILMRGTRGKQLVKIKDKVEFAKNLKCLCQVRLRQPFAC